MHLMPSHERLKSEAKQTPVFPAYPRLTLAVNRHGFYGSITLSNGYDYLLVMIDHLTSEVHLIPTMTRVTTKEVAWPFLKETVRLHRVPESIMCHVWFLCYLTQKYRTWKKPEDYRFLDVGFSSCTAPTFYCSPVI